MTLVIPEYAFTDTAEDFLKFGHFVGYDHLSFYDDDCLIYKRRKGDCTSCVYYLRSTITYHRVKWNETY